MPSGAGPPIRNRLAHDALYLPQCGLREMNLACRGGLFELFRVTCSDYGYINCWLGQYPRNRQLRHGHSFSLSEIFQLFNDREIALKDLAVEDFALAPPVIRCEGRLGRERSGEQS